ncbi:MAG: DUF4832 domain-containing protein [Clostridiales bacterium]|jgi:hypothetical protein|nr:DUF4832 domain-containing protein [Clostridiales bacterium]
MNKYIKIVLLFLTLTACTGKKEITQVDYRPQWDTLRVIKNPNKGWYHHLYDNQVVRYNIINQALFDSFPGMDHLYLRLAWSFLEPEEGVYNWALIDDVVSQYVPRGFGISISITCKETGRFPIVVGQQKKGVQYATPVWVEEAGAKGVVTENDGVLSWSPVWDDPVYLQKLDAFHQAFAARYDGQPWLRYVDVSSIGEWGEGHTSFSTKIPPTVKEVKDNINIHLKHYKKTLLVATDDLLSYDKPEEEVQELYDYAVNNGLTIRDDSPMVAFYLEHYLDTWSVASPHFYDPLYKKKPIILELQHYWAVKEDGNWIGKNGEGIIPAYHLSGAEIITKVIETMHATYIGYHGYAEEWLADNPDLTNKLANRCGYWYFPVSASLDSEIFPGENKINITWLNKGVAPAYNVYSLLLKFTHTKSGKETEIRIENSHNLNWLPNEEKDETYTFTIPSALEKGDYRVSYKLLFKNQLVDVGIKATAMDKNHFVNVGVVALR